MSDHDQNFSRCVGCGQSRLERTRIGAAEEVPIKPERPASGFEFEIGQHAEAQVDWHLAFESPVRAPAG